MHERQGQPTPFQPTSKGAAYIADFLIRQKVPYIFGLCGHGILGLLDGLYDRQGEIKTLSVHHESVSAFMADAYFRIAQKPVATYTSCGPGSANIVVAVAAAFADSSAMLNITGNVPTGQWNRGPFQETGRYFQGDFVNVLRPYVKRSFQPTRPEMLPLALRQAFALMTNGRPGPVHIDVPLNVFVEPVDEKAAQRRQWQRCQPDHVDRTPSSLASHSSATSETGPERAACNTTQNAGFSVPATRLVGITHPFHPYRGRQFVCVGERCNASGRRVLLSVDEDTVCAVPLQWTDLVALDPEMVLGQARSALRVGDLVELARLVARLSAAPRGTRPRTCQANCAASVNETSPR